MAQPQPVNPQQSSVKSPAFDIQAEIERIRSGGPLLTTQRDDVLHEWLDEQRESGNPGFICSAKGSGVSDSCQYYRMQHVKRRGVIQQLPVSVVYMRVPTVCSVSHFYTSLLDALSHPITTGRLKDKRPRARGRLKSFQTKLLIVDDAEFLSYEAFCELAQIYDVLKIPAVLCGTYYLEKMLKKRYWDRVMNSFLDFHEYPPMTLDEMVEIIDSWETEFLQWPGESDLLNAEMAQLIHEQTGGLRDALNEVLRKAAIKALKQKSSQITADIIQSVVTRRVQPRIKPGKEDEE
ncbi:AAA family ATPase [Leptolyngbya iicbica]|uniref:ORC1/DEAH AAA+ ATPase domain-containing protein n=2 Tax=Cyanophyceae TaxID=3028117 RepID=A0A4Q7E962_9CYAN|nr:AAA family ATPase [Leptolyngbya sp. LK]RZM79152.1 hypothetical protein DYY88_10360 [Leptolyngbya sp. LK]